MNSAVSARVLAKKSFFLAIGDRHASAVRRREIPVNSPNDKESDWLRQTNSASVGGTAAPLASIAIAGEDFYVDGDLDGPYRTRLADVRADPFVVSIAFVMSRLTG